MSSSALDLSAQHLAHVSQLWLRVKELRVAAEDDRTPLEVSESLHHDLHRAFLLTKALRRGSRLNALHARSHAERMALEHEWEAFAQNALRRLHDRLDIQAAWNAAHAGWQAPEDPPNGCLVGAVPVTKRLVEAITKRYYKPKASDYKAVEKWGGERAALAKKALDSGNGVVFRDITGNPTAVAELTKVGNKVVVGSLSAAPIPGKPGLDALQEIAKEAAKTNASMDVAAASPAQTNYFAQMGFVKMAPAAAPEAPAAPEAVSQTMNLAAQFVAQFAMQGGVFPSSTAEVQRALASGINEEAWKTGAFSEYIGLAAKTAEQAGAVTLEQLGLHKTFEFANPVNMANDMFGVRGSKVIQNLYGDHMDKLSKIVMEATAPKSPLGIPETTQKIRAEWPKLSKYQAERIARTETASVWMATAANAYEANGISEWESIVASGPSIEVDTNGACDYCVEQAAFVHDMSDTDLPPYHPNCRCDIIPVLEDPETGEPWLPPDEPWAGGGDGSAANFVPTPAPEPGAPTGGLSFSNVLLPNVGTKAEMSDSVRTWSTAAKGKPTPGPAVPDAARTESRDRALTLIDSGLPLKVMRDTTNRVVGVASYSDGYTVAGKRAYFIGRIETESGSRYAMVRSFAQDTWGTNASYLAIDSSVVPTAMSKKLLGMGFKPLAGQPEVLYLDRARLPEVFKFDPAEVPPGQAIVTAPLHEEVPSEIPEQAAPPTAASATGGLPDVHFNETSDTEAFNAVLRQSPYRQFLTEHTPEEVANDGTRMFISEDGRTCFAVTREGDVQNVVSLPGAPKGAGQVALKKAIDDLGGKMLDCYDGFLPDMYEKYGFQVTGRMRFVEEYAQEGWDYSKFDNPDVTFMSLNPPEGFVVRDFEDWNRAKDYSLALSKNGSIADAEAADFASSAVAQLGEGKFALDALGNDAKVLRYTVSRKAEEQIIEGQATKTDLDAFYRKNRAAVEKAKGKLYFDGRYDSTHDITRLNVNASYKIKARAEEAGLKEDLNFYTDTKTGEEISLLPEELDLPKDVLERIQQMRLDGWPQPKGAAAQAIFGDAADTEALYSDGLGHWVPERQVIHEDIVWQFFKDKKLPAGAEVEGVTLTSATDENIVARIEDVRAETEGWVEADQVNTILDDIQGQIGVTGESKLAEWNLAEVRDAEGNLQGIMGFSIRREGEKNYLTVWGSSFRGESLDAMRTGVKGMAHTAISENAQLQVQLMGKETMMNKLYKPEEYGTHAAWTAEELPAEFGLEAAKPTIYLTSGGGAAGKGSSIFEVDGKQLTLDELKMRDDMIVVDPDYIKTLLPEYKTMVDAGDRYAASGVHEESSALAKTITKAATQKGYNIVLDTTGSGKNFIRKLQGFKDEGYVVKVSMTSVPTREAIVRSISRGDKSGRYVPVKPLVRAHSEASQAFAEWKDMSIVDEWKLYDNLDGRVLVAEKKLGGKIKVYEPVKYQSILAKAGEAPPRLLPELPPEPPPFVPSGPAVENWAYEDGQLRTITPPEYAPGYSDWEKGLSGTQKKAIDDWTTSTSQFTYKKPLAEIDKFNKTLDSVIAGSPVYDKPVTVWRGITMKPQDVDPKTLNSPYAMGEYLKQKFKVGDVLEPGGFQSATFTPDIAVTFTAGGETVGEIGVVFEIKAVKGANLEQLSAHKEEAELLLSRNEKWKVLRVTQEQFQKEDESIVNRFVVQVEQIPPEPPLAPADGKLIEYTVQRDEEGKAVFNQDAIEPLIQEMEDEEWPHGLTLAMKTVGIGQRLTIVRDEEGKLIGAGISGFIPKSAGKFAPEAAVDITPIAVPARPDVLLKVIMPAAERAAKEGVDLKVVAIGTGEEYDAMVMQEFRQVLRERGFEEDSTNTYFRLASDKIADALPEMEPAGQIIAPKMLMPPEPYDLNVVPVGQELGLDPGRAEILGEEIDTWTTPPGSVASAEMLLKNAEEGDLSHIIEGRDSEGVLRSLTGLQEDGMLYLPGEPAIVAPAISELTFASTIDVDAAKQAIANAVGLLKSKGEYVTLSSGKIGLVPEAKEELRLWLKDRGFSVETAGGLPQEGWYAKMDDASTLLRSYELKTPGFGKPLLAEMEAVPETDAWILAEPYDKPGTVDLGALEDIRAETDKWFQSSEDASSLIDVFEGNNGYDVLYGIRDKSGELQALVGTFRDQVTKNITLFDKSVVLKYMQEPQEFARAIGVVAKDAEAKGYGVLVENFTIPPEGKDSLPSEWIKTLENMGFKRESATGGEGDWFHLTPEKAVKINNNDVTIIEGAPAPPPAPVAVPPEQAPSYSVGPFKMPNDSILPEAYTSLEMELNAWTEQSARLKAFNEIQFAKANPVESGVDELRVGGKLRGISLYDHMPAEPSVGTHPSLVLKTTTTEDYKDIEGQWMLVQRAADRAKDWEVDLKINVGPGSSKLLHDRLSEVLGADYPVTGQYVVVPPEELGKIIAPTTAAPAAETTWTTVTISESGEQMSAATVSALSSQVADWPSAELALQKISSANKIPDFGVLTMVDKQGDGFGIATFLDPESGWRSYTPFVVKNPEDGTLINEMLRGMVQSAKTAGRDGIYAVSNDTAVEDAVFSKFGFTKEEGIWKLSEDDFDIALAQAGKETKVETLTDEELLGLIPQTQVKFEAFDSTASPEDLEQLAADIENWAGTMKEPKGMTSVLLKQPAANPDFTVLSVSRNGEKTAVAIVNDKSHIYSSVVLTHALSRYDNADGVIDAIRAAAALAKGPQLPLDVPVTSFQTLNEVDKKIVVEWMKNSGAETKNLQNWATVWRFDEDAVNKIAAFTPGESAQAEYAAQEAAKAGPTTIYVASHRDQTLTTLEINDMHLLVSGWPNQVKAGNLIAAGSTQYAGLLQGADATGQLKSLASYVSEGDRLNVGGIELSHPLQEAGAWKISYQYQGEKVVDEFPTIEQANKVVNDAEYKLGAMEINVEFITTQAGQDAIKEYKTILGALARIAESENKELTIQVSSSAEKTLLESLKDPKTGSRLSSPIFTGSSTWTTKSSQVKGLLEVLDHPNQLPGPIPEGMKLRPPPKAPVKPPAILMVVPERAIIGYKMKWLESGKVQEQTFLNQADALAYFNQLIERDVQPGTIYTEELTRVAREPSPPGSAAEAVAASRPVAPGGITKDTGTTKLRKDLAEHMRSNGETRMKDHIARSISERLQGDPDWSSEETFKALQKAFDFRGTSHYGYESGSDEHAISDLIHNWAITSSDGDVRGVAIQIATKEEFNLPVEPYAADHVNDPAANAVIVENAQKLLDGKGYVQGRTYYDYQPGEQGPSLRAALRAFLREQYNETQEYLKSLGVDEVTIYRGMSLRDYNAMNSQGILRPGAEIGIRDVQVGLHPQLVRNNSIASWSIAHSQSAHFASGTMLRASIPRELIIGTPWSGFGCAREWEVVVLERGDSVAWVAQNGSMPLTAEMRAEMTADIQTLEERLRPMQTRMEQLKNMGPSGQPPYSTPEYTEFLKLREEMYPLSREKDSLETQLRTGNLSWSYSKETDLKNYITAALEKDHTLAGKEGARPVGYTAAQWNKVQSYNDKIAEVDTKINQYQAKLDMLIEHPEEDPGGKRVLSTQGQLEALNQKKAEIQDQLNEYEAKIKEKKVPATGPVADAKKKITSIKRKISNRQKKIDIEFEKKWALTYNKTLGFGSTAGDLIAAKLGIVGSPTFTDLFAGTPGMSTVAAVDATLEQVQSVMAYWGKWLQEQNAHFYAPYWLTSIGYIQRDIETLKGNLELWTTKLDEAVKAEQEKALAKARDTKYNQDMKRLRRRLRLD